MARKRWCGTCDNEALPNTVPPACGDCALPQAKAKSREGKCTDKTKFNQPCTYNAKEGTNPPRCIHHERAANGENALQKAKNCRYREIDGCTVKAARGFDECVHHIEDPEERARQRKRRAIERITGSERLRKLMSGEMTVEELDDDEILEGKFRDVNGKLTGRPPAVIPREVHEKMTAELFRRADNKLKARLFEVLDSMTEIAADEDGVYEAKDRIRAGMWVVERIQGKTPDIVKVTQERPFEVMYTKIAAGARSTRGSSALELESEEIEEAELVDEEQE